MNKKWYLILASALIYTSMLFGCNLNDDRDDRTKQTPVNYENRNVNYDRDYDMDNDVYDRNINNLNAPGVDEDDNMLRDDENDANPDPEDIVEDPKDMFDRDRTDE